MQQPIMQSAAQQAGTPPAGQGAQVQEAPTPNRNAGPPFTKPDVSQFIPQGEEEMVGRVIAAGHKLMFAPEMRKKLMQNIGRSVQPARKMAEGSVGLMLTLDGKVKGGISEAAMVPILMEFLSLSGEVLQAAGQQVSQQTWNESFQYAYTLVGKKLGKSDEQIKGAAEQAFTKAGGEPGEGAAHEQAEAPGMEQQEVAAEAQGMPEPDEQMRGA